jgi:hypothetical protein
MGDRAYQRNPVSHVGKKETGFLNGISAKKSKLSQKPGF